MPSTPALSKPNLHRSSRTAPGPWLAPLTAIALAIGAMPALAQTSTTTPQATIQYAEAAGPLRDALESFARASGTTLTYDLALVAGRSSPGLRGLHTPDDGLAQLLRGTGLQARALPNGAYALFATGAAAATGSATQLSPIEVRGTVEGRLDREGSAQAGYRANSVSSLGALGRVDLKDAPYTIQVIPRELIANIQAQSPDDVYRINPTTVSQTPQGSGWAPMVRIRGYSSYDRAEDGMRRAYGYAASLEDKERVEVLSGLSGFLYGAASPGGMVNYVYKRPTRERLNEITLGNYGGSQYYVHADLGGPIDTAGKFGYRINLVRQDGDTVVDDQSIERMLVSTAFDWQVTDKLRFELDANYTDYRTTAPTAYWAFREGVERIAAPDASKNWGQPWIHDRIESKRIAFKANYEVNEHLSLRAAYLRDAQDRPVQDHTMNSVRSTDAYYQNRIHSGETRTRSEAVQALADARFSTGALDHNLTAGYYGYTDRQWGTSYSPNSGWLGPFDISSPTHVAEPVWPAVPEGAMYYAGRSRNHTLALRLNVSNVADRSYWLNSYYLGSPRSTALSAQMQF